MSVAQRVTGPGIAGGVTTAATQGMATAPAPYDSNIIATRIGAGAAAIAIFPATPGKAWLLSLLAATVGATGAQAGVTAVLQVFDGVTVIFQEYLPITTSLAGVYPVNQLSLTNLGLVSTIGNSLTITFNTACAANQLEMISVGAYLI
jgi:hypothetical protein